MPEYPSVEAQLILESVNRAACDMCDHAGYRGQVVCDHVDRTEITRRGAELVRLELALARKEADHA